MDASNNLKYKSVIKRCGRPILPPLMTEERREEMIKYRRLAEAAEIKMKRKNVRQCLKSRIGELFEKYRQQHSTSTALMENKDLQKETVTGVTVCNNIIISSNENERNTFGNKQCDDNVSNSFYSLLDIEPPSVTFRIIPSEIESVSSEGEHLDTLTSEVSLCAVSPSDVYICLDSDGLVSPSLVELQIPRDKLLKDQEKCDTVYEIIKKCEIIAPPGCTEHVHSDENLNANFSAELTLPEPKNNSKIVITPPSKDVEEVMPGDDQTTEEIHEISSTQIKPFDQNADFSPDGKATKTESETSFRTVTPSTDLEKYMDSSAETWTSPSAPKSPESLDYSLATEFSSKSEDVTVINLSSGTDTPIMYEEENSFQRETSVLKDVLNIVTSGNFFGGADLGSECAKRRIRRNSYTLESPSPVLMKALEKNCILGPICGNATKETISKKQKLSEGNKYLNFDTPNKSLAGTALIERCRDISLYPRREHLVKSLTDQYTVVNGNVNGCKGPESEFDSEESAKNLKKGILKYSEEQISVLQTKRSELRKYLDAISDRVTTTEVKKINTSVYEEYVKKEMAIPISMIKEMMLEQEERLEQLRQQLMEEHRCRMAELFEQQQLQWQKLAAFIQNQDDPIALVGVPRIHVTKPELPIKLIQGSKKVFPIPLLAMDPVMKPKFDRVSAVVKGFLTRRLMKSDKVQSIIQTIRDTVECALKLHAEFPQKGGFVTEQDAHLHQRLIVQLNSAIHEFHDIFFSLDIGEKMSLIAQTRNSTVEKSRKIPSSHVSPGTCISSATLKVLARKHGSPVDERDQKRRSPLPVCRSHSCPPNRRNQFSPSGWKSPSSGRYRAVSRKVTKLATRPVRP